jgi:hypothetical protein
MKYYPHRVGGVIVGLYANPQDFTDQDPIEGDSPEALPFTDPTADPKIAAAREIEQLERTAQAPRFVREALLDLAQDRAVRAGQAAGLTQQQALALLATKNAGYIKLKALDDQIAVLRAIVRGDA